MTRVLHVRGYDVQSVLVDDSHFRLIGFLKDERPEGAWGLDDGEPLVMHHMQVSLLVRAPELTIEAVEVEMLTHPQHECPSIIPLYQQLVGLSIVRGFTLKVRELFGGPRACTHVAALLNAMGPVAVQSMWSFFHVAGATANPEPEPAQGPEAAPEATANPEPEPAQGAEAGPDRWKRFELNRNSCHVWADNGPMHQRLDRGEDVPVPLSIRRRLAERGLDASDWKRGGRPAGS